MEYKWYQVFNLDEFLTSSLVSKAYEVVLVGIGNKSILVTRGNEISIVYEDRFLPINFNEENPYSFGERAVYLDASRNVWLGFQI